MVINQKYRIISLPDLVTGFVLTANVKIQISLGGPNVINVRSKNQSKLVQIRLVPVVTQTFLGGKTVINAKFQDLLIIQVLKSKHQILYFRENF